MRNCAGLLVLLSAATANAGGIKAVAVEDTSGRRLSRAQIRIERIEDGTVSEVKNRGAELPDGRYLVSARRRGFAPAEYGQKKKLAPGRPIRIQGPQIQFIELRLPRLGAISGRVLDENGVGLPDHPVVVYPPQLPLRIVSQTKTDDRGVYRAGGLLPGQYLVRTAAWADEDGVQWLPTFAPQAIHMRDAKLVDVDLDREVIETNVEPVAGSLFSLSGTVSLTAPPSMVFLTLAADTGRKEIAVPSGAPYSFEGLAPGNYELLAQSPTGVAAHRELFVDREIRGFNMQLAQLPRVEFRVVSKDASSKTSKEVGISVRRRDYAGDGPAVTLSGSPAPLAPGFWDVILNSPPDFYWATLDTQPPRRRFRGAEDDRTTEILVGDQFYSPRVSIGLSNRPARLRGTVTGRGEKIASAPVFLWPVNPDVRKRLGGWRQTRTGLKGEYRFDSLAPGEYLVLSSFDIATVNHDTLTAAAARSVTLEEGKEGSQDLDLPDPQ